MFALLVAGIAPAFAGEQATVVAVPVPVDAIYPGTPIRDDQIVDRNFKPGITRMAVHQSREAVVGKVARRVLLPGRPIPVSALKTPDLVTAGQTVMVVYAVDGLEITARAVSLQSGKLGETVPCRNVDSGMVIQARVAAEGMVRVDGG